MGSIFKAARAYEWVRRFQVREEKNYLILILVEPHREPSEAQTGNLLAEMEKIFGAPYSFKLEMRDELPLAPSGKYQYLVPLSP
jgi:hypothetical protein